MLSCLLIHARPLSTVTGSFSTTASPATFTHPFIIATTERTVTDPLIVTGFQSIVDDPFIVYAGLLTTDEEVLANPSPYLYLNRLGIFCFTLYSRLHLVSDPLSRLLCQSFPIAFRGGDDGPQDPDQPQRQPLMAWPLLHLLLALLTARHP